MTNGEKFKQIFSITQVDEGELYAFAWLPNHDAAEFSIDWWNANYSEIPTGSTTKNDLGVDAISRDEVCRYVAEFVNHEFSTREEEELIDNIITGIEHMPSVTPQEPRWIPVSERLPEIQNYSGNYLVTLKSGGVHIGMFIERNGKHWWTHYDDVVAWMPLPEPFEPQESEE